MQLRTASFVGEMQSKDENRLKHFLSDTKVGTRSEVTSQRIEVRVIQSI